MGSLPVLNLREVAALLMHLGFQEVRQRGSHRQYWHPDREQDGSADSSEDECHVRRVRDVRAPRV
jgi:hypothetical protein